MRRLDRAQGQHQNHQTIQPAARQDVLCGTGRSRKGHFGSANFTVRGLGQGNSNNNIELNLIVDGNRDRQELKQWFDELWSDPNLVKDVKQEVLSRCTCGFLYREALDKMTGAPSRPSRPQRMRRRKLGWDILLILVACVGKLTDTVAALES